MSTQYYVVKTAKSRSKQKLILSVMNEGAVIPAGGRGIFLVMSMADQTCKCSYLHVSPSIITPI